MSTTPIQSQSNPYQTQIQNALMTDQTSRPNLALLKSASDFQQPTVRNLLAEQPQSGSFVNNLLQTLQNYSREVSTLNQLLSAQRASDKAAGTGLFEGAAQFSSSVSDFVAPLLQSGRQGSFDRASFGSQLENLGRGAQNYLIGTMKAEALNYLSSRLGVDAGKLTLNQAADVVGNLLGKGELALSPGATGVVEGLAGTAGQAAKGAGSAVASEAGSLTSGASKVLGAAGAAYSVYNLISNFGRMSPAQGAMNGASAGAYIGSVVPGVGTVIGGAVGAVVGAVCGLIKKSGKGKDQLARDSVRDYMQKNDMVDKDWNLHLANGATFDIGKDGKSSLMNKDGGKRLTYETDFSNPLTGPTIGLANPLAYALCGGDRKLATAFAGYFTNAAISNTDDPEIARQNMVAIFETFKTTPEQMIGALGSLAQSGKISDGELQAFTNGIKELMTPIEAKPEAKTETKKAA